MSMYTKFFKDVSLSDINQVGGKNASLGELWQHLAPQGVQLPNGFATTSDAYRYFLESAGIRDRIADILASIDVQNVKDLQSKAAEVRGLIIAAAFPADLEQEIRDGYAELCRLCGRENLVVAIRSSATAEDLPNASFAGQ